MSKLMHLGGSRRRFIRNAGATVALSTGLSMPHIAKAARIGQDRPDPSGDGLGGYPAAQLRYGAQIAIADINAAGGIKSMGGAQIEALLGDSQTKPEIGAAEVEKMNEAGVHALQDATSQLLVSLHLRRQPNTTFRSRSMSACRTNLLAEGCRTCSAWRTAMAGLPAMPRPILARSMTRPGLRQKTVVIVHEGVRIWNRHGKAADPGAG